MNNEVLKKISYGVYVITVNADSKATGCVANSLIQVTYDTVAISLNHDNFTNFCLSKTDKFAISILGENISDDVIPVFGYMSGRDVDKFAKVKYLEIEGLRVIEGALGYLICDVVDKFETETHTIFLGKIIGGDVLNDQIPMTYAYYHKVKKGITPKNAPTYISEIEKTNEIAYKCSICGYIYHGDITLEGDSYVCPVCRQSKSVFIRI